MSIIEPNAATPTVLPIERKKIVDEVAAPICSPRRDVLHRDGVDRLQQSHAEPGDDHPDGDVAATVVASIRAKRIIPTATSTDPVNATGLYLPVRDTDLTAGKAAEHGAHHQRRQQIARLPSPTRRARPA